MNADPGKRICNADRRIDQNADKHDNKQEAGSAARMKTRFGADVFNCQLLAMFIAEDCFVFSSVIAEQSLYIIHMGDEAHIKQQYHYFKDTFGEVSDQIRTSQGLNKSDKKGRKKTLDKRKTDNKNQEKTSAFADTSAEHVKELEDELLKLRIENAFLKELRRLRLEDEAKMREQLGSSAVSEDDSN